MPADPTLPPHYRPELDGLRSVAVLGVILFHLHAPWLPGGFSGVDVFFVLSGYLVTSVILREQSKSGAFSYSRFYQRRIARIFPAFLTMTIATLMVASAAYSSWDLASTASAFAAALISISNYHQLSLGDYFHLSPDAQPLLHCWSLSVEEQFYLIFPLMLGGALRLPGKSRSPVLLIAALASFLWNLHLTEKQPVSAFYLLPSRAWELLVGSLLAMAESRPSPTAADIRKGSPAPPHPVRSGPSLTGKFTAFIPCLDRISLPFRAAPLGLAAILLSFCFLSEAEPFPGWRALFPVLATAALIRGCSGGPIRKLLSSTWPVRIGKLSYSLYLWHWPVFSFVDYILPYQSPPARLLLKLLATVLCSTACHQFIENPARRLLNLPRHRLTAFLLTGLSLLLLVPLGHRLSARHYLDGSTTASGILTFPAAGATRTLMLIGDSQASMYGQLARDLATAHHLNLVILSKAGEDPLTDPASPPSALHLKTLQTVREQRPDIVILACHWIYKLQQNPARLALTLDQLQPHTRRLILLTQPPLLPPQAERSAIRSGSRPPYFELPSDRDLRHQFNLAVKQQSGRNIEVLDLDPLFTNPDGSLLTTTPAGRAVFHDKVHLSADGAALLTPWLDPLLAPPPSAPPASPP